MMSLIVEDLRISKARAPHDETILPPLDFEIKPGSVLALMGRSGIGKSTILAAIAGNLSADFVLSGAVRLDGEDVLAKPMEARRIGLVFQDALLFPHLNVAQNLAFGMPKTVHDRAARVEAALGEMGLETLGKRDPATLSGGEASRIALQRSLLAEPAAILLDEPFSKLDQDTRAEIRRWTFDEIKKRNIPALLVTHDRADAEAAGGEVIALG